MHHFQHSPTNENIIGVRRIPVTYTSCPIFISSSFRLFFIVIISTAHILQYVLFFKHFYQTFSSVHDVYVHVCAMVIQVGYRKTSDRSPRLLSVQVSQTAGLYAGPGVYPGPGFYPKFYGIPISGELTSKNLPENMTCSISATFWCH